MPAINLRDVPEEVVRSFKVRAAAEGLGLRDWILKSLTEDEDGTRRDGVYLRGSVGDGRADHAGGKGSRGKGNGASVPAVPRAHGETGPSKQPSAVEGRRRPNRSLEGSGKKCEDHGKVMRDFGNAWVCDGPPSHKEYK